MSNPNCFSDLPGCKADTSHTHFDVYYGGSRDGQRFELDKQVQNVEHIGDPNGDLYVRHPDLDTTTDRAWVHVSTAPAAAGVHVEPQPGQKALCLQDLRTLVATADRLGHKDDAPVFGRLTWKGKVAMLGLKAEPH